MSGLPNWRGVKLPAIKLNTRALHCATPRALLPDRMPMPKVSSLPDCLVRNKGQTPSLEGTVLSLVQSFIIVGRLMIYDCVDKVNLG